jgi:hypothetical protein
MKNILLLAVNELNAPLSNGFVKPENTGETRKETFPEF